MSRLARLCQILSLTTGLAGLVLITGNLGNRVDPWLVIGCMLVIVSVVLTVPLLHMWLSEREFHAGLQAGYDQAKYRPGEPPRHPDDHRW